LIAASITRGLKLLGKGNPFLAPALCAALLLALSMLTWRQSEMYADTEALWRATLKESPNAFLAHNNLGMCLLEKEQVDDAIAHFRRALEIQPSFAEAHADLAFALLKKGQVDESISHSREALQSAPALPKPTTTLAGVSC